MSRSPTTTLSVPLQSLKLSVFDFCPLVPSRSKFSWTFKYSEIPTKTWETQNEILFSTQLIWYLSATMFSYQHKERVVGSSDTGPFPRRWISNVVLFQFCISSWSSSEYGAQIQANIIHGDLDDSLRNGSGHPSGEPRVGGRVDWCPRIFTILNATQTGTLMVAIVSAVNSRQLGKSGMEITNQKYQFSREEGRKNQFCYENDS